jgi:2-polyprenyl-6-hydroxyphenyl methylase/3-demethylubiquinone-9 3-methyltransferase
MTTKHATELLSGERFAFGSNWANFLRVLNDARIAEAEQSLRRMLNVDHLHGKRVLDIGSGSGLFSLAARRLGATVHSFDYDPESVACTTELRRRNDPIDDGWVVESGSVLDAEYLRTLGTWDVVYSWGVLHHTGAMWEALNNVSQLVAPEGLLFISIYNDQQGLSVWWRWLKRTYNRLPRLLRTPYALAVLGPHEVMRFLRTTARSRDPRVYFVGISQYAARSKRGMSYWHDLIDWIGGYPFEVATPEAIFDFCAARGFEMVKLKTCGGGLGCNEFVFRRSAAHA